MSTMPFPKARQTKIHSQTPKRATLPIFDVSDFVIKLSSVGSHFINAGLFVDGLPVGLDWGLHPQRFRAARLVESYIFLY
jgi:hypothetical protein